MKRALVIVNPTAGQRTPEDTRSEIEEAATEHAEWRCEIRETTGPGDAARWAGEAAAEGFDRVIAVGGDGTVTEAAAGLLEAGSDLPLAAIPVGTANVLGEVLRVPSDLGEAVAVALTGEARDFDIGHLPEHDRYFLIGIGIGIPGKTVENADRTAKDRFGFAAYVFAFLEGLAENRSAVIDSTIDGEPHIASGQSVIVANLGQLEVLGLTLGEGISPHDRALDVLIIDHGEPRIIWDGIGRLFGKREEDVSGFVHRRGRSIHISANPALSVQIDGEWIGRTPLAVEIADRPARLIVGPDYGGD